MLLKFANVGKACATSPTSERRNSSSQYVVGMKYPTGRNHSGSTSKGKIAPLKMYNAPAVASPMKPSWRATVNVMPANSKPRSASITTPTNNVTKNNSQSTSAKLIFTFRKRIPAAMVMKTAMEPVMKRATPRPSRYSGM